MSKKNKENKKIKSVSKNWENQNQTNQNSIIKELKKINRNLDSNTYIGTKLKRKKKIEQIGKYLSIIIPMLISTALTIYIYIDNKQLSIDNIETTKAMNDFTKSNASIKYELRIENIQSVNDKTNLIRENDSVRQEKLTKLTANVQINQGSIRKGYLVQDNINKPITESCFKYLGAESKMTSEFMSYGSSFLKTGQFYLVFEDINGNFSINFVQVQSVKEFDASFSYDKDGVNNVTIFSAPISYMKTFDLSYDELIDAEKIKNANEKSEKSFLNYQKEALSLSKTKLNSIEMRDNIDKGFEELSKNKVEKTNQKEILSDIQEIKKIYQQYYN
ncbi:hypothetical protein HCA14_02590 [Listeria welshimeri]|nr:hypothetical protein [Listeria welshimeri]